MTSFNIDEFLKKQKDSLNPQSLLGYFNAMDSHKPKKDERFWECTPDAAGNATAIIRFLPNQDLSSNPLYTYYHYSFVHNNKYYIENSLDSIGLPDPCKEENDRLWASGDDGKEIAKSRNRKQSYISNILVVRDNNKPENNGKVFLFRFGVKIYGKMQELLKGNTDLDIPSKSPYRMDEGYNFALIRKTVAKFPNYDDSRFVELASPVGDIHRMEEVFNQLYDVRTVVEYKSYNELKDRLETVLGRKLGVISPPPPVVLDGSLDNFQTQTALGNLDVKSYVAPISQASLPDEVLNSGDVEFMEDFVTSSSSTNSSSTNSSSTNSSSTNSSDDDLPF